MSCNIAPAWRIASSLRISGWVESTSLSPVGADQQQVLHIRPGQQILEQIERCCIEPLQIVEEQGKRMFRPREYADKSPEHQLKAALRILWRKLGDRWLFADDVLQFRDEIHNEPSVRI